MKTIGLIGGISSFSTAIYYNTINKLVNDRLGGSHSAKIILHSIDFHPYKILQENDDWIQIEDMLCEIADQLTLAGADCIVICSNTPHLIADNIRKRIKLPLIHIAEVTASEMQKHNIKKAGLLGTKFTLENSFFTDRLTERNIDAIIPEQADREMIHSAIINEFTRGIFSSSTKMKFQQVINNLQKKGAEAIIFGCTEIILLINPADCDVKIFDTTAIHAKAAVDFTLATESNKN